MSQAWLSYDDAPPFWLPASFFGAAMLWLLTLGCLLLPADMLAANRYHPQLLALTHALGLGVLGNIMSGALLQMLAVASGVATRHAGRLLLGIFLPWQAGTALLVGGFLHGFSPLALQAAAVLLCAAIIRLAWHGLYGLARSPARDASSRGMALALVALLVTALLGLCLVLTLSGQLPLPLMPLLHSHVLWAALGWLFLLVLAVSQTVIPMFLITPPYPAWTLITGRAVLVLLLACSLALLFWPEQLWLPASLLLIPVLAYAVQSWRLLRQSRRPADPLWWQWQGVIACLLLGGMSAWLCSSWTAWPSLPLLAGLWWLGGAGLGATLAMLGKILPFLAWLHLKRLNPPRGLLPSTHGFLPESAQLRMRHLHLLWLLAGTLWCWQPGRFHLLFALATLELAAYALVLGGKLARRYRAVQRAVSASTAR
ncbi:hypothetical protein DBR44_09850 [Aquitalea sp. FJL05]|uniref:hypothetical protein n=1 Tax=Aquitalea TaxID=407217 RepID=UPI000F5B4CC7|nr:MULTISPECIES: hypothetical protein [Aquitalea]RQO73204.1 hypothetical protein DBR44_09850 [Aquitalea sp. FJL05]